MSKASSKVSDRGFRVPINPIEWDALAKKYGCDRSTLSSFGKLNSASKLTEREFLSMRTLWPKAGTRSQFPKFSREIQQKVRDEMKEFPEMKTYFANYHRDSDPDEARGMGAFLLVRLNRWKVEKPPSAREVTGEASAARPSTGEKRKRDGTVKYTESQSTTGSDTQETGYESIQSNSTPEYQDNRDERALSEQTVNDWLVISLQAMEVYKHPSYSWLSDRGSFGAISVGTIILKSDTDGVLKSKKTGDIHALIEVKRDARKRTTGWNVFAQESAEMIAWIMHDHLKNRKSGPSRRVIVSQGGSQICLTQATFSPNYLDYIGDKNKTTDEPPGILPMKSFLVMKEFGKWDIKDAKKMREFARIMLSLVFEAEESERASEDN